MQGPDGRWSVRVFDKKSGRLLGETYRTADSPEHAACETLVVWEHHDDSILNEITVECDGLNLTFEEWRARFAEGEHPTRKQLEKLWATCKAFITKHDITCGEVIYQTDGVILGAYEFIEDVCDVVGYVPIEDE